MGSDKRKQTELKFAKWVKEGRGSGRGRDYKPWLTVRDVPSLGRSHRVFGHRAQRTHHLLSDLELAVFLLLDWHLETTDIREQFPLPQRWYFGHFHIHDRGTFGDCEWCALGYSEGEEKWWEVL